jgi:hypothetical protein
VRTDRQNHKMPSTQKGDVKRKTKKKKKKKKKTKKTKTKQKKKKKKKKRPRVKANPVITLGEAMEEYVRLLV